MRTQHGGVRGITFERQLVACRGATAQLLRPDGRHECKRSFVDGARVIRARTDGQSALSLGVVHDDCRQLRSNRIANIEAGIRCVQRTSVILRRHGYGIARIQRAP